MANYKTIIGVTIAASVLLSACIGRQGVVGQQGAAGQQGFPGQQAVAGQSAGTERRRLFGQQNRASKDAEPVPTLEAKDAEPLITAKERFAGTVAVHNTAREKKDLSGLVWSETLANYAQEWADHLAKVNNCQLTHRPETGEMKQKYGENLWWADADVWSDGSRKLQSVKIERVVASWASEAANYNYDANSCMPGKQCNNYTQIVWQDTTSVGCGYQQCSDKSQVWVCNYNPPGNFADKKPY